MTFLVHFAEQYETDVVITNKALSPMAARLRTVAAIDDNNWENFVDCKLLRGVIALAKFTAW